MALVRQLGPQTDFLWIRPFEQAESVSHPDVSRVGGEYAYVSASLCAIYGHRGELWVRAGDIEEVVTSVIVVHCEETNDALVTRFTLPSGVKISVSEPFPATLKTDPCFDHWSAIGHFWGYCIQEVLSSEDRIKSYFGFARNED